MNISIKIINHKRQRYDTAGDWLFDKKGNLIIYISKLGNWKMESLIAYHEMREALLCKHLGISQKSVDDFDIAFERKRQKELVTLRKQFKKGNFNALYKISDVVKKECGDDVKLHNLLFATWVCRSDNFWYTFQMASLRIKGGKKLNGMVTPSGNKNSILPILCASLLTEDIVQITNVPNILDVQKLLTFFSAIGSHVEFDAEKGTLQLQHNNLVREFSPDIIPAAMRSSVLLFAPLLFRLGFLQVHTNTKGCALGVREIDPHLTLLKAFGYDIEATLEYISLRRSKSISGVCHWFDYASVTATENFAMAATTANGKSILNNAASEPHVQDLCRFLNDMGAAIDGIGSNTLTIQGKGKLHGCKFSIPDDHHEVATYLAIGAITGGHVSVKNNIQHHLPLIDNAFQKLGVKVLHKDGISTVRNGRPFIVQQPFTINTFPKIEAAPWPYFPADLLPPFIALATACKGNVLFWNKVYEGGLSWIPELNKFGAFAHLCDPHKVIVIGNTPLHPATVESPYIIRASIALLMVALSAPGESLIHKADPIQRAHPRFIENLQSLGADVSWEM